MPDDFAASEGMGADEVDEFWYAAGVVGFAKIVVVRVMSTVIVEKITDCVAFVPIALLVAVWLTMDTEEFLYGVLVYLVMNLVLVLVMMVVRAEVEALTLLWPATRRTDKTSAGKVAGNMMERL